jgi:hypothetical protein
VLKIIMFILEEEWLAAQQWEGTRWTISVAGPLCFRAKRAQAGARDAVKVLAGKRYLEIAIPLPLNQERMDAVSKPFRDYYEMLAEARITMRSHLASNTLFQTAECGNRGALPSTNRTSAARQAGTSGREHGLAVSMAFQFK